MTYKFVAYPDVYGPSVDGIKKDDTVLTVKVDNSKLNHRFSVEINGCTIFGLDNEGNFVINLNDSDGVQTGMGKIDLSQFT